MTDSDNAEARAEAEVDRLREHVRLVRQRAAEGLAGASEVSVAEYELNGALKRLDALTDGSEADDAA